MATLNFPDPNSTQTYEAAGITWTWNATLGVWSTDGAAGFKSTVGGAPTLIPKQVICGGIPMTRQVDCLSIRAANGSMRRRKVVVVVLVVITTT